VVYADVDGHIGYQATGLVPIRPATPDVMTDEAENPEDELAPGSASVTGQSSALTINGKAVLNQDRGNRIGMPVNGADDSHEWLGYVPFDKLPSTFDPPEGIIATANARITPVGYPYLVASEWGSAYRAQRIYRVLNNEKKFSAADMLELQTDVFSDFDRFCAQRFVYAIDHSDKASARARVAAEMMRNWDGRVTTDSNAAPIIAGARAQLFEMLLEPKLGLLADNYSWFMSSVWLEDVLLLQPPQWLPQNYSSYDALLTAAVEKAIGKDAPHDLSQWRWGKESHISIQHPLFGSVPILRRFAGTSSLQQSGNGYTVKQVGATFGPSERMTVDFSNLDSSTLNIVTGQSGNIFSPHYKDQWSAWYDGRTFTLPFTQAAVQSSKAQELIIEPK
jgi:penicillin amidase